MSQTRLENILLVITLIMSMRNAWDACVKFQKMGTIIDRTTFTEVPGYVTSYYVVSFKKCSSASDCSKLNFNKYCRKALTRGTDDLPAFVSVCVRENDETPNKSDIADCVKAGLPETYQDLDKSARLNREIRLAV